MIELKHISDASKLVGKYIIDKSNNIFYVSEFIVQNKLDISITTYQLILQIINIKVGKRSKKTQITTSSTKKLIGEDYITSILLTEYTVFNIDKLNLS